MLVSGDLFATSGGGFLARGIRMVQWFWSSDNEATYNHVGIVLSANGRTLEARWHFDKYNLKDYIGYRVLIVRHRDMTKPRFVRGYNAVRSGIGCHYPVWRFVPFILHLAKFIPFGKVCSEWTGAFMKGAGFSNIVYGLTPDDLADRWRIDKDMDTIFEGVLTEEALTTLKEGAI